MGTAYVTNLSNKLCSENISKRKTIIKLSMKEKLADAWRNLRKEKCEEQKMWRELKGVLRQKRRKNEYNRVWAAEKDLHFDRLREKKRKKVTWLTEKYYKPKDLPDTYEGVSVGNQELDERFKIIPECYGNVNINMKERDLLRIHPKYTVFDKIDVLDCEAEIEKSLTKIRWLKDSERREKVAESKSTITIEKRVYNIDEKQFNYKLARSTDLPFNISTYMPKSLEATEEVKLQCLKRELMKITEMYNRNTKSALSNLSQAQKEGLKSLKQRQDDNEIVVFQTDKSGKIVVDSLENYIEAAKPHIGNDEIITLSEYNEKKINAHSVFWLRMLQVGKESGDEARYKKSMLQQNSQYASLYMYRKDHKVYEDTIKGPPVRVIRTDINCCISFPTF